MSLQVSVVVEGMYENTAQMTFIHVIERMVASNTTVTHRDTVPPTVTIIGPDGAMTDGTTTYDETPSFKYILGGDPLTPGCLSPWTPPVPPLVDGPHTFYVQGEDAVGNLGPIAQHDFLVDLGRP